VIDFTRYVVARAYKAQNSSSFPPVTAAAAHALAGRAVRPVSHTPTQSSQHKNGVAARGAQRPAHSNPKNNFEFSKAACNKCAPRADKIAQKRGARRNHSRNQPRAGILSAK